MISYETENSKALAIFLSQNFFFVYQKQFGWYFFISLYSYKLFGTSAHFAQE